MLLSKGADPNDLKGKVHHRNVQSGAVIVVIIFIIVFIIIIVVISKSSSNCNSKQL